MQRGRAARMADSIAAHGGRRPAAWRPAACGMAPNEPRGAEAALSQGRSPDDHEQPSLSQLDAVFHQHPDAAVDLLPHRATLRPRITVVATNRLLLGNKSLEGARRVGKRRVIRLRRHDTIYTGAQRRHKL